LKKNIHKYPELKKWLPALADRLFELKEFTVAETEAAIRDMASEFEIKPGVLINGIRTVVTGQLAGPGLFDVLEAVGRHRVVERLRKSVALFV
jgi:glutamyl-tRNA synthetase